MYTNFEKEIFFVKKAVGDLEENLEDNMQADLRKLVCEVLIQK